MKLLLLISRLSFTQSADTLVVVHPNFAPFKVVRGATDTTWTATTLSLTVFASHCFYSYKVKVSRKHYTISS